MAKKRTSTKRRTKKITRKVNKNIKVDVAKPVGAPVIETKQETEKVESKQVEKSVKKRRISALHISLRRRSREPRESTKHYWRTSKVTAIIFILLVISFAIAFYYYPLMPDNMVAHWNMYGQADGNMSKDTTMFLMPVLLLVVVALFMLIPKIDPLKHNIEKFNNYFAGFIIIFMLLMLSVQMHLIFWNLGIKINPAIGLPIGLGILFFYIGIMCEHSKRNWSIGVRTPWTLSSENVWNKTHKVSGKMFKVVGIISILGVFSAAYAFFFVIIPVIVGVIYIYAYSYFEYQKEHKKRKY